MRAGITNIRRIVCGLLVLILLGTPVCVCAQSQAAEINVKLDVQYGFQNNIKSNEAVPIRVKVECLNGFVSGKIKIEIPVQAEGDLNASIWMSDMEGRNNKAQCYIWERELSLEEGAQKEEIFYIELPVYESYINVSVISGGQILEFQQIHCDCMENSSRFFVGIISEYTDEIARLNGVQISNYYHEEIFLKAIALDREDIYENPLALEQLDMLIVDSGVEFSEEQKMAIEMWENNGGIYCERSEERLWDIISRYQTGEESQKFQALFTQTEDNSYYSEMFDQIPLKEKISIGKYIFIIILYLVIIGPGLYWLLKEKKEPYWLLGSVCLVSLFFMFLINFMGRSINMSNPAIFHQTIYTQEGEDMKTQIDFSVQAYQMKDFALYFDEEFQILPKSIGVDGAQSVDNIQGTETITFSQMEEKQEVLLQNISAYRINCFSLDNYKKLKQDERITFKISGDGDYLQIDWENPTNYYLKEAVVVLKNRIAIIGDIKPCSHGSIENAKLYSYSSNGMSLLLEDLLDFSEYTFSEHEIQNLSNIMWENLYSTENGEETSFIIGILENETNAFAYNPGFEVYGTSLMKIDVEIDWRNEQIQWCSNLETYGTVYKGEYMADTNLLYSREAIVDYPTSHVGLLKSLEFFYPDYSRQEESQVFDGKIYIFNWKMGRFTEVMFANRQFSDIPLEQYISDTGVLRIYYVMDERKMKSDCSYILPCIKISGEVE